MAQRLVSSEANQRGSAAGVRAKHSTVADRLRQVDPPVVRMPAKYTARDVEVLLNALWSMFTESQAQKLKVLPPWEELADSQPMRLYDVASVLERWLEEGKQPTRFSEE